MPVASTSISAHRDRVFLTPFAQQPETQNLVSRAEIKLFPLTSHDRRTHNHNYDDSEGFPKANQHMCS